MNNLFILSGGAVLLASIVIIFLLNQKNKKKQLEIKNLQEKEKQQKNTRKRYSPGNPDGIVIDEDEEKKNKKIKVRPRLIPQDKQDNSKIRNDAVLDVLGSHNVPDNEILKQSLDLDLNNNISNINITRAEEKVPTILIVDDSKTSLKSATRALEKDYNIITAEDGIDALEKMREKKPDLVVTDVDMPRLNGLDLVTRMKETLALSDIPIIVVTGNVELHFKIGAHEGVDSFLPKPYSANDLLGQTKFLLGQ
ncbi:response regulator [Shigella flexneri]